ncbi:MAG: hypothetical protein AB7L28_02760 [Kofleriaceae bacterium]
MHDECHAGVNQLIKPADGPGALGARDARLRLVASPDGADGSVTINANARIYAGIFGEPDQVTFALPQNRYGWVHVARGKVRINGVELLEGDGVAVENEAELRIEGIDEAEILVFDLA